MPVFLNAADGEQLNGGSHGVSGCLEFSCHLHGKPILLQCTEAFAYSVDLHNIDMIIGYPLLKALNLTVDASLHRLDYHPPHPVRLLHPPAAESLESRAPQNLNLSIPTSIAPIHIPVAHIVQMPEHLMKCQMPPTSSVDDDFLG